MGTDWSELYLPGKPSEEVEMPTKSELTFPVDMKHSLHQEGSWHIVPQQHVYTYFGTTPYVSHVVHVCSKSWVMKSEPDARGVEKQTANPHTVARLMEEDMMKPCEYCGEIAPDGLVGLWKLHNWDYLSLNEL